ncbi:LuxR C-terminal-related transcriptional regulator [Streptomyces olivaceoviridis]|uniref:LuxR C-terminal-related transcriptional regulator n=1 Tax=Streptomyces olivaceoviridis TaxID=1921 RepID=UPI0036AB3A5B
MHDTGDGQDTTTGRDQVAGAFSDAWLNEAGGTAPALSVLPPEAQAVYRSLLMVAPIAADVFVAGSGDGSLTERCLRKLVAVGLVREEPDGLLHACSPRTTLEAWAARREAEAAEVRSAADVLAEVYAAHQGLRNEFFEVVEGRRAVRALIHSLQDAARREVRVFDRGPYLDDSPPLPEEVQLRALRRGTAYRVVYESGALHHQGALLCMRASVSAGEQARVFPDVPMKLLLSDTARGLVILPRPTSQQADALLVYPSPLLDALTELFEAFWRLGVPVSEAPEDVPLAGAADGRREPSPETQRLLSLLTAGLTDESIARELGVSYRTVSRRIGRLQELLGARTRFQLGVQAARRGWL